MGSNTHIAHRCRRWGLGAGAGIAAAMLGMTAAPAAHADDVASSTDLLGLLDSALADVTTAHDVFTQADLPAQFESAAGTLGRFTDTMSDVLDKTAAAQEPLLSNDSFAWLADVLFGNLDQQFAQDSDAFLTASQGFVADPSVSAEIGLLAPQYQLLGDSINAIIPDAIARFVDVIFGLDGSDAAGAAADLAGSAGADTLGGGADLATGLLPDFLF